MKKKKRSFAVNEERRRRRRMHWLCIFFFGGNMASVGHKRIPFSSSLASNEKHLILSLSLRQLYPNSLLLLRTQHEWMLNLIGIRHFGEEKSNVFQQKISVRANVKTLNFSTYLNCEKNDDYDDGDDDDDDLHRFRYFCQMTHVSTFHYPQYSWWFCVSIHTHAYTRSMLHAQRTNTYASLYIHCLYLSAL